LYNYEKNFKQEMCAFAFDYISPIRTGNPAFRIKNLLLCKFNKKNLLIIIIIVSFVALNIV